jgi:gamma-glutamyltranspeptidase / glutathione hydrolase
MRVYWSKADTKVKCGHLRLLALGLFILARAAASEHRAALDAAAVASPDRYGALAAAQVLRAGGNAVDAAVATGFALAVTYPEAGNLGGGGFMTLYMEGKPYFLDYRETAPGAATANLYLDAKGEPVPDLSVVGNLSSGVPGTVSGLYAAHQRFAKLTWQRDLAPAIGYARYGFLVTKQLIGIRDGSQQPFLRHTNFQRYFGAMQAGKVFKQPQLAATLERIAKSGPQEFYQGRTARLIVAQMQRGAQKGLISASDLARYEAKWRDPVIGDWEGMTVITAPPPSSGGIALLQMLRRCFMG